MPYFFLSYARGDDDPYVKRFFTDLSREVRTITGLPSDDDVGFLDTQSLRAGDHWPQRLTDALSTCRTFIALCSPGYFLSRTCGVEWAAFARRMRRYHSETGVNAGSLVPLRWYPVDPMPEIARHTQWEMGGTRRGWDGGVRQLLRLHRYRDTYLDLTTRLARDIVRLAAHRLPPLDAPIGDIESAFHTDLTGPTGRQAASDVVSGSQYVHFVVAAPSRAEAEQVRRSVEYYGATPAEWSPYRPVLAETIAQQARRIAASHQFSSEVGTVEQLRDRMAAARRDNQVVVLLVDPWVAQVESQRGELKEYDRLPESGTAIMIPLSEADTETQQQSLRLSAEVYDMLRNSADRLDKQLFHFRIPTDTSFAALLGQALAAAQNQIFVRGTVHQVPPGEPVGAIPRFEGSY